MSADPLSIVDAIVLGIVEGVTEFLPISSTGHLLVVSELIGFGQGESASAADTYAIAIQFGAIMAVLALYRTRIASMWRGATGRDRDGRAVLVSLVLAFLPAALFGALFGDTVKDRLFGPVPVTIAWAVGGIVILAWLPRGGAITIEHIPTRSALIIGVAQVLALWPGVSRSLVTLLAALAVGLTLSAAVEFSFLLGLITLTAATMFDTSRYGAELVDSFGVATPLIGVFTAFVTALVAVRWMVGWLSSRSLAVFGWYRLMVAGIAAALIATGVL